ncbi:Hypothetical predicted protein [Cloeon dipterum]|uniref:Uncharacterized protein n=1 Tax=Cloeon dipterum TaxID=197152 RepID=A0A8S1DD79_9INSE|nr:Hypothetical predicted protein [Cloeon dipterum]
MFVGRDFLSVFDRVSANGPLQQILGLMMDVIQGLHPCTRGPSGFEAGQLDNLNKTSPAAYPGLYICCFVSIFCILTI